MAGLSDSEQLERAAPSGNNAFMAMQYNDLVLDRIVRDYFRPAVEQTGFNSSGSTIAPKQDLLMPASATKFATAAF